MKELIEKLKKTNRLNLDEWVRLLSENDNNFLSYVRNEAVKVRKDVYGDTVYIRGLIEISNFCKNDCYYCGIRKGNRNLERYRLSKEDILNCCHSGYNLGFRTFVLQGGEDPYFTDDIICDVVSEIHRKYPDCAITLSLGEKSLQSYKRYYDAGAERYLLRHETADPQHYAKLHPAAQSFENRIKCLEDLKSIGYQVGCGMMVGSPFQTVRCLAEDMVLLQSLRPHMVGIGPFIPHKDTPFRDMPSGSLQMTTYLLSLIRLTLPYALIPATTALGTLDKHGREEGILSGANVIMPNLSPGSVRQKYMLYNNKLSSGAESAENIELLKSNMNAIGYRVVIDRGDCKAK